MSENISNDSTKFNNIINYKNSLLGENTNGIEISLDIENNNILNKEMTNIEIYDFVSKMKNDIDIIHNKVKSLIKINEYNENIN